jgi:transcriptional regulator with XRE-family HTH domain
VTTEQRGSGSTIGPAGGPTVLRILLGAQLRRLREAKGISREDAGYLIRASESKISRMELGRVGFKERDIADLLSLYGITHQDERAALLALARQAKTPGWWQRYGDILPSWFQTYLGLEEAASLIRTYEVQFVPGLLQTEDYARAVITHGNPGAPAEEIERRVSLRMKRQQLLTRSAAPPQLWAVVDEAALRRPMGSPAVMAAQIEGLIKASELPNVTLQVLPFHVGAHSAEAGAFTILRFPEPDLPDVVYTEQLTGALYLDKREDVDAYMATVDRLSVESAPPRTTIKILSKILQETTPDGDDAAHS